MKLLPIITLQGSTIQIKCNGESPAPKGVENCYPKAVALKPYCVLGPTGELWNEQMPGLHR